jgi:hypothetical protein
MTPTKAKPMTDKAAYRLASADRRAGKAPFTQAGHYVHEEIEHAKEGKHPVQNTRQAIAIGLSKARKAGIRVPPKRGGRSRGKRS